MKWLIDLITIPRFELIIAWGIAIIAGMMAGAGWALYHNLRDKTNSLFKKPPDGKIDHTSPICHPNNNQNNHDDAG